MGFTSEEMGIAVIEHHVKSMLEKHSVQYIIRRLDLTVQEVDRIAKQTHHGRRIPVSKTDAINALLANPGYSQRYIAKELEVSPATVYRHTTGRGTTQKKRNILAVKRRKPT